MSIEIKTKKIIVRGEQERKIIGISLLKREDLPKEYTDGGEYVAKTIFGSCLEYQNCNKEMTNHTSTSSYLELNEKISEESFRQVLINIRRCGNRLREINERLAKKNADWHGEETFVI